jgi:hypothetical protein
MTMNYEELDETTRESMLREFEAEEAGGRPYRSKDLSAAGRAAFTGHMRDAIRQGTEVTLGPALSQPHYWNPTGRRTVKGVDRTYTINPGFAAERLALTEFSTWYVHGFAARLLAEGVTRCEIYRGAEPKGEPAECSQHEGQIVAVQLVYDGHRARYWPEPGDPTAFSIPAHPNCHHLIRRLQ